MGTALARQREFNPRDYKDQVHDLARVNPEKVAESVTRLARRKNAADGELDRADRATTEIVGTIAGIATVAAVGHWDGKIEAARDAMLAEWTAQGNSSAEGCPVPWEMEGVKDPTVAFWIVPKLLIPPLASGLLAVIASSGRKSRNGRMPRPGIAETTFSRIAQMTFGYAIGSWARSWGYCARERQISNGEFTVSIAPKEVAA